MEEKRTVGIILPKRVIKADSPPEKYEKEKAVSLKNATPSCSGKSLIARLFVIVPNL